jgi:hypothetical protein
LTDQEKYKEMLNPVQSLRRAEAQLEKQLGSIAQELANVRSALQVLTGKSAGGKKTRRKMSAATRAKMRASAKKRWAAKKAQ